MLKMNRQTYRNFPSPPGYFLNLNILILIFTLFFSIQAFAKNQTVGIMQFDVPKGWQYADMDSDAKNGFKYVKTMVVGKSKGSFPPSLNLVAEPYKGTLREYLQIVKSINQSAMTEWKDLGLIKTEAGPANLSQVDTQSEWGTIRLMHVIIQKDQVIYILTAAALKDEFSNFYQDFFKAMRSLRYTTDLMKVIDNPKLRASLEMKTNELKEAFKSQVADDKDQAFNNPLFQKEHWEPYKQMLNKDYDYLGEHWHQQILTNVENELLK